MKSAFNLSFFCLALCLGLASALDAVAAEQALTYRFKVGDVSSYKMNIVSETAMAKVISGSSQPSGLSQVTTQDLTLEQTVKKVDQTGNAELLMTFKSAKMEAKVATGASREPQPPDIFKFLTGRALTAFITADGKILAVDGVVPMLAVIRETSKDAGLAALAEQTYSEDFFKELFQHLYPQLPMDPTEYERGWETVTDLPLPRTEYKLRVTMQSSLAKIESGAGLIRQKGKVTAVPVDPDAASSNPMLPTVEVLSSDIAGEAKLSIERGQLLENESLNDLTLRTTMRIKPPSSRGAEFRTEVITRTRTTTSVKLAK